jgi:RHS repeat-associated protein
VTSIFLTDALASTIALADPAGSVPTEYTYEPFGRTTSTGLSNSNPSQYTSRENDATGVYYYRNRYYNPLGARFVSEDPIDLSDGNANRFIYGNNNPVNKLDPLGLYVGGVGVAGSFAAPVGGSAIGGAAWAGWVNDSQGNWGYAFCGALGGAQGGGGFVGVSSVNNWGARSICDMEGVGTGLGLGGGGRFGGGWGPGGFVEVMLGPTLLPTGIASGVGIGFGGFTGYGGFGGCFVIPVKTSCDKCR